jgi:signal peptidase I
MKSILAIFGLLALSLYMSFALLIMVRTFAESHVIHSNSMYPTLHEWEHLGVEKISTILKRDYRRGQIILYYPPPTVTRGKDLSGNPLYVLGRLTGLAVLPYENAFATRVIGLPGERIRISPSEGVFINNQLLDESSYIREPAHYQLLHLADFGGQTIDGVIHPYDSTDDASKEIVVPTGKLFVLCDNRNAALDSHVCGFLDQKRVIGRAQNKSYWGSYSALDPPTYPPSH